MYRVAKWDNLFFFYTGGGQGPWWLQNPSWLINKGQNIKKHINYKDAFWGKTFRALQKPAETLISFDQLLRFWFVLDEFTVADLLQLSFEPLMPF